MKIAAWSGPRNLSTAMLYAFGSRTDCAAWDEPFYAPYLTHTGTDHPMTADIQHSHETDPSAIAQACAGAVPLGRAHWYMKHMPHHMLPGFDMNGLTQSTAACLGRNSPSYRRKSVSLVLRESLIFWSNLLCDIRTSSPSSAKGDKDVCPGGTVGSHRGP